MSDFFPLPYCPECGWVTPNHNIHREGFSAWGFARPLYASGPVDWRTYPEFRCGCRIVHEAREAGLIDEACGGRR